MPGGPINPYLADVWSAFAPGAQLAGYGPPSATPVVSGTPLAPVAPPPNATGFPALADVPPAPPPPAPAGPPPAPPPAPPAPPPAAPFVGPVNPSAPPISVGVDPGPQGPPAPASPAAPQPGPDPHAFDLVPKMGGGSPAHEVDLRGPTLRNAQDVRQDTYASTIGAVGERNARAADNEYQMAVSQERAARLREAAYQQSLAEQDEELQARQDDFDQTARQLSRLGQIDHGRFWASRSTGQKIAGALEVMLSGFTGGQSMIQKRIDDDIKAQEFAYMAGRDAVNAKQSAFSAAMQKYQNANAARLAARVASQDVVAAQLGQIAALNKGNETGNRALEALAQLSNDRMLMTQQAIKLMPAQSGGRYWQDKWGLIYNETEAKALRAKQVEYAQQERIEGGKVGGQLLLQRDKAALDGEQNGGLGKENAQKLALEETKGRIERDALLNAIGYGQDNVKAIVKGGVTDDAIALAPAWAPGATKAREMVSTRESYNNTARLAVAAAYKLSTDATEPKNRALLEEYAGPYVIGPGDNEASALHKMKLLRGLVERGAASKGVTSPNAKPAAMPGSFERPGK